MAVFRRPAPACSRPTRCGRSPTPADTLAVACHHVIEHGAVPLDVIRYDDKGIGDLWVIACGEEHAADDGSLGSAPLAHLVRANPSLAQLAVLPSGTQASRKGPDAKWIVTFTIPAAFADAWDRAGLVRRA